MKKKFLKRLFTLCMACVFMIGMSIPAFAATLPDEGEDIVAEYTINASSTEIAVLNNSSTVSGTAPSNGVGYAYPHLDSYIGFSKVFHIVTSSSGTSGAVLLYLYNEKGKLVSNDWIMGVNDGWSWKLTLPSSGTYTLKVCAQGTTAPVKFTCQWE